MDSQQHTASPLSVTGSTGLAGTTSSNHSSVFASPNHTTHTFTVITAGNPDVVHAAKAAAATTDVQPAAAAGGPGAHGIHSPLPSVLSCKVPAHHDRNISNADSFVSAIDALDADQDIDESLMTRDDSPISFTTQKLKGSWQQQAEGELSAPDLHNPHTEEQQQQQQQEHQQQHRRQAEFQRRMDQAQQQQLLEVQQSEAGTPTSIGDVISAQSDSSTSQQLTHHTQLPQCTPEHVSSSRPSPVEQVQAVVVRTATSQHAASSMPGSRRTTTDQHSSMQQHQQQQQQQQWQGTASSSHITSNHAPIVSAFAAVAAHAMETARGTSPHVAHGADGGCSTSSPELATANSDELVVGAIVNDGEQPQAGGVAGAGSGKAPRTSNSRRSLLFEEISLRRWVPSHWNMSHCTVPFISAFPRTLVSMGVLPVLSSP